ncbi:type I-C CRISPR-associated protein Cas7/Csd2 [Desulfovibrio sp. OttesenSCG-928-G15]|nr:type I-C CRISPR-associated protein Cas7/Csd2 [Desulfovibrio sp. OttesenSCG-928-G15]
MTAISNRYEFILFFDVENGNPNGDPDADNMPRIDPETGHGVVTDVCLKRKIRNFVELAKGAVPGFDIYVKEKAVLTTQQKKAYTSEGLDPKNAKAEGVERARSWMCQNFYDVRSFGAVMSLKEANCGQVRGPVQMAFAKSVEPVMPREVTVTRMAVATEKEAKAQSGDNRTMGHKFIIPYALYRAHGFISAPLAEKTGFSEEDLALFWQAVLTMFEHDRSAARGEMTVRKLFVFKHADRLGNAPAHTLFDLVHVEKTIPQDEPARAFSHYMITIKGAVPQGVEVIEKA